MAHIIHIIAGGPDWVPTDDDLKGLVKRFKESTVVMHGCRAKVETIDVGTLCNPKMIITAGSPDWEPTTKELDDIQAQFMAALRVDHTSVIATRSGVKVRVIHDFVSEASAVERVNEMATASNQFTASTGG